MAFRVKGQGATEYLVLLAVVLIIALVSIALLGFFPGISTDAKITQSSTYWKAGRPFAILEHTIVASTTGATIVMQNSDASGTLILNNITFTSGGIVTNSNFTNGTAFAPGEIRTIYANASSPGAVASGTYDLTVMIDYTTANGVATKQYGGKSLVGKYI